MIWGSCIMVAAQDKRRICLISECQHQLNFGHHCTHPVHCEAHFVSSGSFCYIASYDMKLTSLVISSQGRKFSRKQSLDLLILLHYLSSTPGSLSEDNATAACLFTSEE